MDKKIEFEIDLEGNVAIKKVEGYGAGCLEATKFLESTLGHSDESTRRMDMDALVENSSTTSEDNQIQV